MVDKLAVVTDSTFWRNSRGDEARIYSLISGLTEYTGFQLHVLFCGKARYKGSRVDSELSFSFLRPSLCDRFVALRKVLFTRYRDGAPFPKKLTSRFRFYAYSLVLSRQGFDAIIFEYLRLHPLAAQLKEYTKGSCPTLIVDIHDIQSSRADSFKNVGLDMDAPSLEEELQLLSSFDRIVSIQDQETQVLQRYFDNEKIFTLPYIPVNSISVGEENIQPENLDPGSKGGALRLGFLGSRAWPNVDGITWFIETVMPYLEKSRWDRKVTLVVAGSVCSRVDCEHPNVALVGFVEDLHAFYSSIDVCINPVRVGSGMKIKSVEALYMKKPLIMTEVAAQGLLLGESYPFWLADTPDAWVTALNAFQSEPPEQLADRIGQYLTQFFNAPAVFEKFEKFIRKAIRQS